MSFSIVVTLLVVLGFSQWIVQASAEPYFVIPHNSIIESTRLDPIIDPGKVSGHVHEIIGASNFDKSMTNKLAQSSQCTTSKVQVDKSSYWAPAMYAYDATTKRYQKVPVSYANTYYLTRSDKQPVTFPLGLRMISGNPNRRTYDPNNIEDKVIEVQCLYDYPDTRVFTGHTFFNDQHCDTNRYDLHFRNCGWKNQSLDSWDHKSHMAWPSNGIYGGACPASHPIAYPRLFMEFHYYTKNLPFVPAAENYVLASGDATGLGYHGDYIAGWPLDDGEGNDILAQALTPSICPETAFLLETCAPLKKSFDAKRADACVGVREEVAEGIGRDVWIDKLPGNNPLWRKENSGVKPSDANYKESATFRGVTVVKKGWRKRMGTSRL